MQAPPNDSFAGAQTVSGSNGVLSATNVAATKEAGAPAHGGNAGGRSVWFKWTAPATWPVTMDTFGSSYDTLLGVYRGSAVDALTPVAGNDDAAGALQSQVTFSGTAGTVYRIAIDGYYAASGNIRLYWEQAPKNDRFSKATAISGGTGTTNGPPSPQPRRPASRATPATPGAGRCGTAGRRRRPGRTRSTPSGAASTPCWASKPAPRSTPSLRW